MYNVNTVVILPMLDCFTIDEIQNNCINLYLSNENRPCFINHVFVHFKTKNGNLWYKLNKLHVIVDEYENENGWYIVLERTYIINYLIRMINLKQFKLIGSDIKKKIHNFWHKDEQSFTELL